jgi:hypothetical protein
MNFVCEPKASSASLTGWRSSMRVVASVLPAGGREQQGGRAQTILRTEADDGADDMHLVAGGAAGLDKRRAERT